jgi:fibronectin type 3 domain-containing protein
VYRSGCGCGAIGQGDFTKIASMLEATTYTDSSVAAGKTYCYYVTAVKRNGEESLPSNPVQATVK